MRRAWRSGLTAASVAGVFLSAGIAGAESTGRYWQGDTGAYWRSGFGACWSTSWGSRGHTPGCDPEPEAEAPAQPAAEIAAAETAEMAAVETPEPVTTRITLDSVALFDFDSARLRPEGVDAVNDIAARAQGAERIESIRIVGHTDSMGPQAYNQKLSQRRAQAVKEQLARAGLDPALIEAEGLGESRPVASNATREGRQQNRRAVVEIVATEVATRAQ